MLVSELKDLLATMPDTARVVILIERNMNCDGMQMLAECREAVR